MIKFNLTISTNILKLICLTERLSRRLLILYGAPLQLPIATIILISTVYKNQELIIKNSSNFNNDIDDDDGDFNNNSNCNKG